MPSGFRLIDQFKQLADVNGGSFTDGLVAQWNAASGKLVGTALTVYSLPTASASVLGGVKVGSGLAIDGSGVLSSTAGVHAPVLIVAADGSGDYTTIAAALTAVPAGGALVQVKAGVYDLSASTGLTLPTKTILRGAGARNTTIKAPLNVGQNAINLPNADCVVEDLEIDGQYASQPGTACASQSTQVGIYVTAARCTIRRCYIHDTFNFGIGAPTAGVAPDLTVDNCTITNLATAATARQNTYKGIYVQGNARPQLRHNMLQGWSQAIGLWFGVTDGLVQQNTLLNNYGFEDAATSAVVASPAPTTTQFSVTAGQGSRFSTTANNLIIVGGQTSTVTAISTDRLTVSPAFGTPPVAGDVVTQHTVNRSACEDYGANNAHGTNRWAYNVVDGSTHNCFEIAQGVVGSSYVGNVCRNWGRNGTTVSMGQAMEVAGQTGTPGGTTDILVAGNYVFSDGTRQENGVGIEPFTSRIQVVNNAFTGFVVANSYPIAYQAGSGDGPPLITGNTFTGCSRMVFVNCNSGITGGIISHNWGGNWPTVAGPGINLAANGDGWILEGNHVDNSAFGGAGILIAAGNAHRLLSNRLKTKDRAIDLSGNNCLVQGNILTATFGSFTNNGVITVSAGARHIIRQNAIDGGLAANELQLLTGVDYVLFQDNTLLTSNGIRHVSDGTHNLTEPNHTASVTKPSTLIALAAQTVGTLQATIPHGLGYTPTQVVVCMSSSGSVWRSAASDGTNVYLTGSGAGLTCDVFVR